MNPDPLTLAEDAPLQHGFSPRPSWAGTCIDCGARPHENCAVMGWIREPYATVTPDRSPAVIVWLLGAIVAALLVGVAVWWTR
jgi:hypothetical protein